MTVKIKYVPAHVDSATIACNVEPDRDRITVTDGPENGSHNRVLFEAAGNYRPNIEIYVTRAEAKEFAQAILDLIDQRENAQ